MISENKLSRKAFWDAVERRLAACSADELRAILRAMAQETQPSNRRIFLARLGVRETVPVTAEQVIQPEDLLAEIEDLAEELDDAMQSADGWEDRYEWGEYYDDEDSLGPYETFVAPLSELFDRVNAAFDYGELALARPAYQSLFELLGTEDGYGRGVHLSELPDVDANETIARYLRAVYETEPLAQRPSVLYTQMRQASTWAFRLYPMLDDLIQISPHPLPDRELFLVDWISFLRMQNAPSGSQVDAWLREAVRLSQGTPGLASLARAEGQTYPRAYLDWFTALEGEGRQQEVLAAAQEALEVLPDDWPIRAAIADHLCSAAARLNEADILRQGRWAAFSAKPTLARLLDLRDAVEDKAGQAGSMQRAIAHIQDYLAHPPAARDPMRIGRDTLESPALIGRSELAHACLLAGDWEAAHQLAAQGKALGWSSNESYQGMVLAAFLALLSGEPLNALPSNLAQLWQWNVQYSTRSWGWVGDNQENYVIQRLERAYTEQFAGAVLSAELQEKLLAWCIAVAQQRVDAIVGNQRRKSYDKAAVLTVACAETLRRRGDTSAARSLVDAVRERFPRHSAFQREMKQALR